MPIPLYAQVLDVGTALWPLVYFLALLVAFVLGMVWLLGFFRGEGVRGGPNRGQVPADDLRQEGGGSR